MMNRMFGVLLVGACASPVHSDQFSEQPIKFEMTTGGSDVARCLVASEAPDASIRADYCATLSPMRRRRQCAAYMMSGVTKSASWCLAEWQNYPPLEVGALHRSSVQPDVIVCDPNDPCCVGSPIILDVEGDGFVLTDAMDGVVFDLRANGRPQLFAWTSSGSDDGWLALDRNGNGVIDDGKELFGNYTLQRESADPNGFVALAEFDETSAGGNQDSVIDANDAVFSRLRVWQDRNHNGMSESFELSDLSRRGVMALSLDYHLSTLRDEHGNEFRYRAEIQSEPELHVGPFAYDVFLRAGPAATSLGGEPGPAANGLTWRCKGICRETPKPGHPSGACSSTALNSIGAAGDQNSACIAAQLNCLTSINSEHCDLVSGSLGCYGCGFSIDPPPSCPR